MTDGVRLGKMAIVGGGGAVGGLLARSLPAGTAGELVLVDRQKPAPGSPGRMLLDDILQPSAATLECIAAADVVVLATPEPVALAALGHVLPRMRSGALLVDTLSVKSRFAAALEARAEPVERLGINPMFAPSLGFSGRSVVAVPYAAGPRAEEFLEFVVEQGSEVVRLGADAHDRACAALQVATHAAVLGFGMALRESGYDLRGCEAIAPPPHRTLLALLARILSADPEVYRDIQEANPYAPEMRARVVAAHRRLDALVATDDSRQFGALFDDLRAMFTGGRLDYRGLCARLFEVDSRG